MPESIEELNKKNLEFISTVCTEYLDFVIEQKSRLKTPEAKKRWAEKNKITTRIIEKDGRGYFSIFKKDKMIDQNDLALFTKRIQPKTV